MHIFVRELLNVTFTRMLTEEYLSYVAPMPAMVLESICMLARVAVALSKAAVQHANVVNEAVRDQQIGLMSIGLQALGHVLDNCTFRTAALEQLVAHHATSEVSELPHPERWHAILVEIFVQSSGMQTCIQVGGPHRRCMHVHTPVQ